MPRVLSAVHVGGRRRRPLPRRARPLPRVRGLPPVAGAVGQPADPRQRGVLLRQLDARARRPRSTRARPAPPSRCCRSTRGPRSSRANPALADLEPDVEAFLVRADRSVGGAECFVVPIDACYELVGRLRMLVAGVRRWSRGARRARRRSSSACEGEGPMTELLASRSRRPRPSATRRSRRSCCELQITEADGRPCTPSRSSARSASSRSGVAYEPAEEGAPLELFGETPQWGDSLRPFLWTHVATTVAGFTGRDDDRPADRVHATISRSPPASTSTPSTTVSCRSCCASPAPPSRSRRPGFRVDARVVGPGRVVPPAGARCGATRWTCTSPTRGWMRVSRDTLDALQRYKATRGLCRRGTSPSSGSQGSTAEDER